MDETGGHSIIRAAVLGILFVLAAPSLMAQSWATGQYTITVQGQKSALCNPHSGDAVNMERCSLVIALKSKGENREISKVVLPWQTASVASAKAAGESAVVFFGRTSQGFEQLTFYDHASNSIRFSLLAQITSTSPSGDYIAYQEYQPPHGGATPNVEVGILSPAATTVDGKPNPGILFRGGSEPSEAPTNPGTYRCSNQLIWSEDSSRVGFCVADIATGNERLILLDTNTREIFQSPLDHDRICKDAGQTPGTRCKIAVTTLAFQEGQIDIGVRSEGNRGTRDTHAQVPTSSLGRVLGP